MIAQEPESTDKLPYELPDAFGIPDRRLAPRGITSSAPVPRPRARHARGFRRWLLENDPEATR